MNSKESRSESSIRRTFSILRTVADDYICLIDVDMNTGREIRYSLGDSEVDNDRVVLPQWSDDDGYRVAIEDYANRFIVAEHRNAFLQATRLEKLKDFLAKEREFIIEYDVLIEGTLRHFQGRFTMSTDDPEAPHMYVGIRDVTEIRRLEQRERESTATLVEIELDDLTGVYTKPAFYYHAETMLRKNTERNYSLIIVDVEGFRKINESYGYATGNVILRRLGRVLANHQSDSLLVERLGGDQFVMLAECGDEIDCPEPPVIDIQKILEGLPIKELQFRGGTYDFVDHHLGIAEICDRAILALRGVKHVYGKRMGHYSAELKEKADRERLLEATMRQAYQEDQFRVYYQAKHDARNGALVGAEALIRWEHPTLGLLSPVEFIPLFEKTGYISRADYYVYRRTCMNLNRWIQNGLPVVPISINVSKLDFTADDMLDYVGYPLHEYKIPAKLIHFEVTETLFSDNREKMKETLRILRKKGFRIELDDFGTGFSSLDILADLPLDYVKMDRGFVQRLGDKKRDRVLSACIRLSHSLKLKTIVEGVENEEELEQIRLFGADQIQGFYYSKPLPEEQFEAYLQAYQLDVF